MRKLVVTGTDTGVGKTWVSTVLIRHFQSHGFKTGAYKPVCSGAEREPDGSVFWQDIRFLREACGRDVTDEMICPQRFLAPLAPPLAARLENRQVDRFLLRNALYRWTPWSDITVIEGAGGLMCPVSDRDTVADLAVEWQAPLVIVAANRLGVVNHTLLSVQYAESCGLQVYGVVLNNVSSASAAATEPNSINGSDQHERSGLPVDESFSTNLELLSHWLPSLPIFRCEYRGKVLIPATPMAHRQGNILF